MVVAEWGDVVSVYHRPSGETHVFNQITAAFLDALREGGSGTLGALVKRVAVIAGAEEGRMAVEDFLEVVARLDELGLIGCSQSGASPA